MRRFATARRVPRHHLMPHRSPRAGRARLDREAGRLSDLILALLGVALLGGLALAAATVLGARALGA